MPSQWRGTPGVSPMSRRTTLQCRAGAPMPSRRPSLRDHSLVESLETRRLLSGVGIASGQVAWVPGTTSAVDASGGASGSDPNAAGATGSGSAGTGTTGPGTLVSPGDGTAVGRTI